MCVLLGLSLPWHIVHCWLVVVHPSELTRWVHHRYFLWLLGTACWLLFLQYIRNFFVFMTSLTCTWKAFWRWFSTTLAAYFGERIFQKARCTVSVFQVTAESQFCEFIMLFPLWIYYDKIQLLSFVVKPKCCLQWTTIFLNMQWKI